MGYELALGGDLIRGVDGAYEPTHHGAHTLARIRSTLTHWERDKHGAALLQQFSDMVFFDAWIGNSDRHQENWGILQTPRRAGLAPIFDTAACLGSEQLDSFDLLADHSDVRLEEYIARCGSGFGDGTRKGLLKQSQVVQEMSSWPEWRNSNRWLPKFRRVLDRQLGAYLASVPNELWPAQRRELAERLLRKRLAWLEAQVQ